MTCARAAKAAVLAFYIAICSSYPILRHQYQSRWLRGRCSMMSTSTRDAKLEKLMVDGRRLLDDALRVARETGVRAGVARSIQAAVAASETAQEVMLALSDYQSGRVNSPPSLARATRSLFERLGATYVKVGQFIASSPSMFPPDFVMEFTKLLDKSPSVPYEVISEIVKAELGPEAFTHVFQYFDPRPLASASIAQVHKARLVTGEEVAVKVLRPGVEDQLKADLGFVYLATRVLETVVPDFAAASVGDIVSDIKASVLDEVDFRKEKTNMQTFRAFLEQANLTAATCPKVYEQYSTRRVLTMELLKGVSLIDLDNIRQYTPDPEATLITALNVWTLSVVACPIFHADVHAGNLLVLQDGRLGFIDFGIVGRIPPKIWRALTDVGEGLFAGDYRLMASGLTRMGATSQEVNEAKLAMDIKTVLERLQSIDTTVVAAGGADGAAAALAVDEEQVTRLLLEITEVTRSNGLRLPREFALLVKQALYFDRYIKLLAPNLDPINDPRVNLRRSQGGGDVIDINPSPRL